MATVAPVAPTATTTTRSYQNIKKTSVDGQPLWTKFMERKEAFVCLAETPKCGHLTHADEQTDRQNLSRLRFVIWRSLQPTTLLFENAAVTNSVRLFDSSSRQQFPLSIRMPAVDTTHGLSPLSIWHARPLAVADSAARTSHSQSHSHSHTQIHIHTPSREQNSDRETGARAEADGAKANVKIFVIGM